MCDLFLQFRYFFGQRLDFPFSLVDIRIGNIVETKFDCAVQHFQKNHFLSFLHFIQVSDHTGGIIFLRVVRDLRVVVKKVTS